MKKLIVLAVFLTGCVPSANTVRLETPLLEGLTVETETEDESEYTRKITCWSAPGSAKPKACLRVTSLKSQYGSSAMLFLEDSSNTPRESALRAQLHGKLSFINVTDEGDSSNEVGKVQYLRLADATHQCVYLLQFSGGAGNWETYGPRALGHTKIEAWYCDDILSEETVKTFCESVTF